MTTIISDQNIRLTTPKMCSWSTRQRMVPDEHLLHRVERAGADVAVDDADRAERQLGQALLGMDGRGHRSSVARSASAASGVASRAIDPYRRTGDTVIGHDRAALLIGSSGAPSTRRIAARNGTCEPAVMARRIRHVTGADRMRVGVPKEIKNHEYRVGLTPPSVAELVAAGHEVVVETQAGIGHRFRGSGLCRRRRDDPAGTPAAVFAQADMIVKVKEPQAERDRDARAAPPAVHLPPPRRRQAAGRGADEVGRDLHRL